MNKYFPALLISAILFLTGCNHEKPVRPEDAYLGVWYKIKGDIDSYSFMKDSNSYIFAGTRGMNPVMFGRWKIDRNKFVISSDNGKTISYSFTLSGDTLTFNDGEEIYTRVTPLEIRYPEVLILGRLASDFNGLKFCAPQPADLNWGFRTDSTQTVRKFTIRGYSISAATTPDANSVKEISEYLKDYGFEPDTVYITDSCIGYWNNNQVVTLCTWHDTRSPHDSIRLYITSGLIAK